MRRFETCAAIAMMSMVSAIAFGQTREEKVRSDREKVESEGFWIYNDMPAAYAEAERTNKPILVALRCLPCEECVKLDDDLIDNDPVVRPLLEQFVCVRVVGTNGLDLQTFQYDTDQSFAMFMLNADKEVYGRFGTRSHRTDWIGDVSIEGMAEALAGALALHRNYPDNRDLLANKRGKSLEFATPETYPSLKDRFTDSLDYEGDVVKSCIHCHQIGDARRDFYWHRSQPIPEDLVFPYPHPKSIGLILDPTKRALVKSVVPDSPAAKSGLVAGDSVLSLAGQPLVSMADVQWVLNGTKAEGASVEMLVKRGGENKTMQLELPANWRRLDNPRWRVASWGFSRMMLGGMRLDVMSEEAREALPIESSMALEVTSVGKYGDHATAKKAGMQPGDIIIAYDGQTDFEREADLFAYANENRRPGDTVSVKFLRDGKTMSAEFRIQK